MPLPIWSSGPYLAASKRAAQGIAECERALALDCNLAEAHAQIGLAKLLMGRVIETEAHVNEALRLSPRDVFSHRWFMIVGIAKLALKEDAEALSWFDRSVEANRSHPMVHFLLAVALASLGSLDRACGATRAGLAITPSFTILRFRDGAQSDNPIYLAACERLYEGMRSAGVPEGCDVGEGSSTELGLFASCPVYRPRSRPLEQTSLFVSFVP